MTQVVKAVSMLKIEQLNQYYGSPAHGGTSTSGGRPMQLGRNGVGIH